MFGSVSCVYETGLVNGQDSVFFHIHVTMAAAGSAESVTTDEPQFVGRRSETDGWLVRPLVQKNDEEPVEQNFIQVNEGDKITLSCEVINPDTIRVCAIAGSRLR